MVICRGCVDMSSRQDSKSLAKHFTHHLRDTTVSIRAEVLELFGISYCRPSSMLGVQINEVGEGSEGFLGAFTWTRLPSYLA